MARDHSMCSAPISEPLANALCLLALHFHLLSRLDDRSNPADYQDTELDYTPLLTEKRDRALLEMLPDYLTEEIQFPRNHAAGFYKKLFENMKNRIEVED